MGKVLGIALGNIRRDVLAGSMARRAGGCIPIVGRRAHKNTHGPILRWFNKTNGAADVCARPIYTNLGRAKPPPGDLRAIVIGAGR